MIRTLDLSARLATLVLLAAACSREEPAPAAPSAPAPLTVEKAKEPPQPVVQDSTFKLALSAPPAQAGEPASAQLTLDALGGYHVNEEYPIKVELKGPPALKLDKASFGKPDATQFDAQRAAFALPFSAPAGSYDLTATVDFAVCTKETCVPDQRTVALALQVR